VIRSFKNQETERVFNRARSRRLPPEVARAALLRSWPVTEPANSAFVWTTNGASASRGSRERRRTSRSWTTIR